MTQGSQKLGEIHRGGVPGNNEKQNLKKRSNKRNRNPEGGKPKKLKRVYKGVKLRGIAGRKTGNSSGKQSGT